MRPAGLFLNPAEESTGRGGEALEIKGGKVD